jgi:hypothetical protein
VSSPVDGILGLDKHDVTLFNVRRNFSSRVQLLPSGGLPRCDDLPNDVSANSGETDLQEYYIICRADGISFGHHPSHPALARLVSSLFLLLSPPLPVRAQPSELFDKHRCTSSQIYILNRYDLLQQDIKPTNISSTSNSRIQQASTKLTFKLCLCQEISLFIHSFSWKHQHRHHV